MPASTPPRPVCRNCDGFPIVAITTGDRHRDGTRVTVRVTCRTCRGTGHTVPASAVRAGR
jgi:RNase P subunit RPR2